MLLIDLALGRCVAAPLADKFLWKHRDSLCLGLDVIVGLTVSVLHPIKFDEGRLCLKNQAVGLYSLDADLNQA